MSPTKSYPLADAELARRLERTEALGSAGYVRTKAALFPDSGATCLEVGGAYALFDGPVSPLTQTFGLGMREPVWDGDLETIEAFYRERESMVFHEVSPLADDSVRERLGARGYRPIEFSSVMFRPVHQESDPETVITVQRVGPEEADVWARTAAEGWSESGDFSGLMSEVSRVNVQREDAPLFVASLEGRAIAAAALFVCDDVALLAGAATIPEARRLGAQRALLETRLRYAADLGCTVAMMCAQPGGVSQRNAERRGFRIAYTRIKWELPLGRASSSSS